jgi:LacI family transcriptional regulator
VAEAGRRATKTKKPATLQDVARAAGVSLSTASRVLNGTGRASAQTRERILRTAERLDFRPDALAKFFATGKSSTVGLVSRTEPNGFALQVLVGAQKALGLRDLAALMYYADGRADTFQEHLRRLRARRVDGVIFLGHAPDETFASLGSAIAAPVVYAFARSDDPADISIEPDGVMAGRLAGEHLIAIGRRRIAHITGPGHLPAVIERATGLCEVLAQAGLGLVPEQPLYGTWLHDWGVTATQQILASGHRVDALFCANDQIALGALRVLHEAGVRVPDDIAIVGYDHWSRLHGAPDPFLTTIDPNLPELGASAVACLLRVLDGEDLSGIQKHPCVLVPGTSTLGTGDGKSWSLTEPLI